MSQEFVEETITVPCTQCAGKGIVASPRATVQHDTCDKCKGDGKLFLRGWSKGGNE